MPLSRVILPSPLASPPPQRLTYARGFDVGGRGTRSQDVRLAVNEDRETEPQPPVLPYKEVNSAGYFPARKVTRESRFRTDDVT